MLGKFFRYLGVHSAGVLPALVLPIVSTSLGMPPEVPSSVIVGPELEEAIKVAFIFWSYFVNLNNYNF